MIKYKYVFWDWNGTLIDDLTTSIDSLNVSLAKRNLPLMTRERYFETFCFPVEEFYRKIGFNLEKESYQILADEFIENYNIEVKKAKLHPHAAEVIATLALNGVKQYILSASEKEILLRGLKKFGIETFFTDIIALDNIYAHGKIGIGKAWFEKHSFNEKALMVGDTYHDYEVASALNLDCAMYTGGHTSLSHLCSIGVPVISDYRELYDLVFDGELLKSIKKADKKAVKEDKAFVNAYQSFYDDQKIYSKVDYKSDW